MSVGQLDLFGNLVIFHAESVELLKEAEISISGAENSSEPPVDGPVFLEVITKEAPWVLDHTNDVPSFTHLQAPIVMDNISHIDESIAALPDEQTNEIDNSIVYSDNNIRIKIKAKPNSQEIPQPAIVLSENVAANEDDNLLAENDSQVIPHTSIDLSEIVAANEDDNLLTKSDSQEIPHPTIVLSEIVAANEDNTLEEIAQLLEQAQLESSPAVLDEEEQKHLVEEPIVTEQLPEELNPTDEILEENNPADAHFIPEEAATKTANAEEIVSETPIAESTDEPIEEVVQEEDATVIAEAEIENNHAEEMSNTVDYTKPEEPIQTAVAETLSLEEAVQPTKADEDLHEIAVSTSNATLPVEQPTEELPQDLQALLTSTRKPRKISSKMPESVNNNLKVPDDEVLKQKLYYGIGEVAEWFGVTTSQIRYWENEFAVLQPRKNKKGDRLFRYEDIKNLQLIHHLLRNRKFSIEGAKDYLKANKQHADLHFELTQSLSKVRSFLLELKSNISA